MQFDSVLNLQAELFKQVFDFVEMPEAMATAAAEQNIPTFVNRRVMEDGIAHIDALAIDQDNPDIKPMSGRPTGTTLTSTRAAGRVQKEETDDIALGVGRKPGGADGDYELVVIYQDRKLDKANIIDRIKNRSRNETRIIYGGRGRALPAWHRERNPILKMGSSIGHFNVTAGTLGCFVEGRSNNFEGVLSNNHVLANVNSASINDAILQPGSADSGTLADTMATLKGFVPIQFGGASNQVDCAWAAHQIPQRNENRTDRFDSADNVVGRLSSAMPRAVGPGDFVMKTGRTTGYTQGEVTIVGLNNLNINMGGGVIARFDGQIAVESLSSLPFSGPGDSGSLIVDINSEPIGLLFAGSGSGGFENAGVTYANPIALVLNALNINIRI